MRTRNPGRLAIAVLAATALLIPNPAAASLTPASAIPIPADSSVQAQVDAYLAAYPGGKQINATEISYAGGTFVVTLVPPVGTLAGPDCPGGWFCFYDGVNYVYPRGKLSSCGWQDLSFYGWHDRTESVHYNLSSGLVWFINHAPGVTHANDIRLFEVSSSMRTRADVFPFRNMADHVYRFC